MNGEQTSNASNTQQTTTVKKEKKTSWIVNYILNHKMLFALLFALIVVFGWGQWRISKLEKEKSEQKTLYENKLDSIHIADMVVASKTFSWAIRSDMMRNNTDQANQYLDNLLKEPHVQKAFVVNAENQLIILSTDKKEIGIPFSDFTAIQTKETTWKKSDKTIRFISPIMGLNKKAGISVIEISTER